MAAGKLVPNVFFLKFELLGESWIRFLTENFYLHVIYVI